MAETEREQQSFMSDRTLAVAGCFLNLTAVGGQQLYPNLFWIWVVCLTLGFGGLLWTLVNWLTEKENVAGKFSAKYKLYLYSCVLAGTVIVCVSAWDKVRQFAEPPDVELVFVDPKSVNVIVQNLTDKIANKPKYAVVIWNLEHPEEGNPLPIPVRACDYIHPRSLCGPNRTMGLPQLAKLVKEGDRLFGYATITCQDCKRDRFYLVSVDHGKSGWYYEIATDQISWHELIRQLTNNAHDRERWIDEQAPGAQRKLIEKSPWNAS